MGKRQEVATIQSVADLATAYRQASDPVERSQRQMLWLIASGRTTAEVAAVTGYGLLWIRTVVPRYNTTQTAGDRRHQHPGGRARALLNAEQQAALAQALEGPAPDGGIWSSAKVAAWISDRVGRHVGVVRGWEYLQRVQYRPLVPRPHHVQADSEAQEAFTKTARRRASGASGPSEHPGRRVDDGCTSHWSQAARAAHLDQTGTAAYRPRAASLPMEVCLWLCLSADRANRMVALTHGTHRCVQFGLGRLCSGGGAGPTKSVVLVLDGAGWHKSAALRIPIGLELVFLPPYSPELQPAERLWTLTNEPLVNRLFDSLDALEAIQSQRCVTLQAMPAVSRKHTLFSWWPIT